MYRCELHGVLIGLGASYFVFNGVEVPVAGTNYELKMAAKHSKTWQQTEDIPRPRV